MQRDSNRHPFADRESSGGGIIDRSPVLHVYASVAEIELFTKFRIRLFDDYEVQSHSVGVDKHSVLK